MFLKIKTIAFYNFNYPFGGGEVVSFNLSSYFYKLGIHIIQYTLKVNNNLLTNKYDFIDFKELPDSTFVDTKLNQDFMIESINKSAVDVLIVQGVKEFPFESIKTHTNCKILFCIHNKAMWEVDAMKTIRLSELSNPTWLRKLEFELLRRPKYKFTNYLEKKLLREYDSKIIYIDKLIFLSKEYEADFNRVISNSNLTKNKELYENKITSIPNPILDSNFTIDKIVTKEKVVLYVGRLSHQQKRVDRLLKIWSLVEKKQLDWSLHILGAGPEEQKLRKQAKDLSLKRVLFKGHIDNVSEELEKSRIICLTSSFEGLPMVLIEGMQYGVIPMSYDSFSAVTDIIEHDKNGFIIPSFNNAAYAKSLLQIMGNELKQKEMQLACLDCSRGNNLADIGEKWINLLNNL